jgi:hypothetical protein
VDLVFLNTASPLLRHQVIKYGRAFHIRSEVDRVEFETRSEREYLDYKRFTEQYNEKLLEDVVVWRG